MSLLGKDGAFYNSVDELMKANARWEQQEKQNKLLEEQNRLISQNMEAQARINEERRYTEIIKQIELQKQTLIQKEEQYRESLSEEDKELYSTSRDILITVNNSRESAVNTINNIESEAQSIQFDLYSQLNKAGSIGYGFFMIKLVVITALSMGALGLLVSSVEWYTESAIIGVMLAGILGIILMCIHHSFKRRKQSKKASILKKVIKKFGAEIIKITEIEIPQEVEYIHQIGIKNVGEYIHRVTKFEEELNEYLSKISNMKEDIINRINNIEDELKAIYKKSKKAEDGLPIK